MNDSANAAAGDDVDRRRALRRQLIEARLALADRAARETALGQRVLRWLNTMPMTRLAFYWPIRGEPDLLPAVGRWLAADRRRRAALPVVAGDCLEFAAWAPDAPLAPGAYGIPVPQTQSRIAPQVLLVPCVGFDGSRYRLGYGGGFYDRTLAAFKVRPVAVGVAFECARLPSVDPRPHDVRLDLVISESGAL